MATGRKKTTKKPTRTRTVKRTTTKSRKFYIKVQVDPANAKEEQKIKSQARKAFSNVKFTKS